MISRTAALTLLLLATALSTGSAAALTLRSVAVTQDEVGATVTVEATLTDSWQVRLDAAGDLVIALTDVEHAGGMRSELEEGPLVVDTVVRQPPGEPGATEILVASRVPLLIAGVTRRTEPAGLVVRLVPDEGAWGADDARPATAGGYTLGVNDLLDVDVFGVDELDHEARVLEDGVILLPLIGQVRVEGLTLQQAQEKIATTLRRREVLRNPRVSLFVKEYNSRGVFVQGAVNDPGVHQMLGPRSLLDMIAQAGGFSGAESVGPGQPIVVLREGDGGKARIEIDTQRLIRDGDLTLDISLLPGDIVLVPYEQEFRVYVSGAVQQPGPVTFSSSQGITLLQAITAAGGAADRAKLSAVQIVRQMEGGQERLDVNLKAIQRGEASDVVLENNDTVIVGESFF